MTCTSSNGMLIALLPCTQTSRATLVATWHMDRVSPCPCQENRNWILEAVQSPNWSDQTICPRWFCGLNSSWNVKVMTSQGISFIRITRVQFYWNRMARGAPANAPELSIFVTFPSRIKYRKAIWLSSTAPRPRWLQTFSVNLSKDNFFGNFTDPLWDIEFRLSPSDDRSVSDIHAEHTCSPQNFYRNFIGTYSTGRMDNPRPANTIHPHDLHMISSHFIG